MTKYTKHLLTIDGRLALYTRKTFLKPHVWIAPLLGYKIRQLIPEEKSKIEIFEIWYYCRTINNILGGSIRREFWRNVKMKMDIISGWFTVTRKESYQKNLIRDEMSESENQIWSM